MSLARNYPKLATLGVFLLILDILYAFIILFADRKRTRFFRALLPSLILLLQVSVTTFLVLAVRKVIKRLVGVRSTVITDSSQCSERTLEKRMRFWIKVNCTSSTSTVALASVVATGITAHSPGPYFWSLLLLILSKQTQVLSQVMIARPPPHSEQVHAFQSVTKQGKSSSVRHTGYSGKNVVGK